MKVALGVLPENQTLYYQHAKAKSTKLENLEKEIGLIRESGSKTKLTGDLLLAIMSELNMNYDSFLTVKRDEITNYIVNQLKLFRQKTQKNYEMEQSEEENIKLLCVFFEEFKSLYDSKDSIWLREYVDLKILLEQIHKDRHKWFCPICQEYLELTEIEKDHFLPRSTFPMLSISRNNIIPICRTCNGTYKGANIPKLPILNINRAEINSASEYYEFRYISKNTTEFDNLKKYFQDHEKVLNENNYCFCTVVPRSGLSNIENEQVKNLIELYKLKLRFNTDSLSNIIAKKISFIEKKTLDLIGHGQSDRQTIKKQFRDSINNMIDYIQSNEAESFSKFEVEMLNGILNDEIKITGHTYLLSEIQNHRDSI